MWLTAPLIAVIALKALMGGANPNWAAASYVAGSLMIAAWLLDLDRPGWLKLHGAIGLVAATAFLGLSVYYATGANEKARAYDPFKKSRPAAMFCGHVLQEMEKTGIAVLVSDNRRRLAECMWYGGFGEERIAVWNPDGVPNNHYEMVASLQAGDDREMLLIVQHHGGAEIARAFSESMLLEEGEDQVYADRAHPYQIWRVRGFLGYPGAAAPNWTPDAATGATMKPN